VTFRERPTSGGPKADPAAVVPILRRQGRAVSREQVEAVFARYDLGKKKASSTRSRR
jgi:hypothetical protein